MKFVKVKKLPVSNKAERAEEHDYKRELNKFMRMNTNCVKVVLSDGEYSNDITAHKCLVRAIKRYMLPIKVHMINSVIYLTRTDI